jgi:hypothetical protein
MGLVVVRNCQTEAFHQIPRLQYLTVAAAPSCLSGSGPPLPPSPALRCACRFVIPETCVRSGSELLRVLNTKQKLSTLVKTPPLASLFHPFHLTLGTL